MLSQLAWDAGSVLRWGSNENEEFLTVRFFIRSVMFKLSSEISIFPSILFEQRKDAVSVFSSVSKG